MKKSSLLILLICLFVWGIFITPVLAHRGLVDEISERDIYKSIEKLENFGSTYSLTEVEPGVYKAVDWLARELKSMGWKVITPEVKSDVYPSGKLPPNIVAIREGKMNNKKIHIIGAHYDTQSSNQCKVLYKCEKDPKCQKRCCKDKMCINRKCRHKKRIWEYPHYRKDKSPGADDNMSGVSAILEIASVINKCDFDETVHLVLFSAESQLPGKDENESHVIGAGDDIKWKGDWRIGSKQYVKDYEAYLKPQGYTIEGMINLDMIGYNGKRRPYNKVKIEYLTNKCMNTSEEHKDCNKEEDELSKKMLSLAEKFKEKLISNGLNIVGDKIQANTKEHHPSANTEPYKYRNSDHDSFWEKGYPAIYVEEGRRTPHYHKADDKLDTLDTEYLTKITEATYLTLKDRCGITEPLTTHTKDSEIITLKDVQGKAWFRIDLSKYGNSKRLMFSDVNQIRDWSAYIRYETINKGSMERIEKGGWLYDKSFFPNAEWMDADPTPTTASDPNRDPWVTKRIEKNINKLKADLKSKIWNDDLSIEIYSSILEWEKAPVVAQEPTFLFRHYVIKPNSDNKDLFLIDNLKFYQYLDPDLGKKCRDDVSVAWWKAHPLIELNIPAIGHITSVDWEPELPEKERVLIGMECGGPNQPDETFLLFSKIVSEENVREKFKAIWDRGGCFGIGYPYEICEQIEKDSLNMKTRFPEIITSPGNEGEDVAFAFRWSQVFHYNEDREITDISNIVLNPSDPNSQYDIGADLYTVPEPCTMFLMGSGLAGLAGLAAKRRRRQQQ